MNERHQTETAKASQETVSDNQHLPPPPSGIAGARRDVRDGLISGAACDPLLLREYEEKMAAFLRAEESLADVGPSVSISEVVQLAGELRGHHRYFCDPGARLFLERRLAEQGPPGSGNYVHYRFQGIRNFYEHVLAPSARQEDLAEELRSGLIVGNVCLTPPEKKEFRRMLEGLEQLSRLAERVSSGEPSLEDAKKLSELLRSFHSDFTTGTKARRILELFYRKQGILNPEEYAHGKFLAIREFYRLIEGKSDEEILILMQTPAFREKLSEAFKAFSTLSKGTKACLESVVLGLFNSRSGSSKSDSARSEQSGHVYMPESVSSEGSGTAGTSEQIPASQPVQYVPTSPATASPAARQITQAITEMAAAAARRAEKAERDHATQPQERIRADAAEIAAVIRRISANHPEIGLELKVPDTKFMTEADMNAMLVRYRDMEASLMSAGSAGVAVKAGR